MLSVAALLLAASIPAGTDTVFKDGLDGEDCPAGRITLSDVSYGSGDTLSDADTTAFENIWGHATSSDPTLQWPGYAGTAPTIVQFTRTGYVAAKFHTPSEMPSTLSGLFKYVSYVGGPNLDFSISGQCADFSQEESGCSAADMPATDMTLVYWRATPGSPFYCTLEPDTDYYVNILLTDPEAIDPECQEDTCQVSIPSYHSGD
jgi:hypothetical protein